MAGGDERYMGRWQGSHNVNIIERDNRAGEQWHVDEPDHDINIKPDVLLFGESQRWTWIG